MHIHARKCYKGTKCIIAIEMPHQRRKATLSRKCHKGRKCDIEVESVINIENATSKYEM